MPAIAIRAEGLGKRYELRHRRRHDTLRDALMELLSAPPRWLRRGDRVKRDTLWALKDVAFEVREGEILGVIGRNGAGKSTLLKILSRITEPTEGRAEVRGRIGSILEIGTGFHPELTGRENISLSGAILGMSRAEIRRKFDAIVAFAEIERFLDTPVKHYSSGMYLRLAFAVAAHLEPEILLVDEVLAVGDHAFQKKCLGKMDQVGRGGRTVLFVSHNMHAVSTLCTRTIWLATGRVAFDGATREGVAKYRTALSAGEAGSYVADLAPDRTGLVRACVVTSEPGQKHGFGRPLVFEFEVQFGEKPRAGAFSFQTVNEDDRPVAFLWLLDGDRAWARQGRIRLRCVVESPRLYMGAYTLSTYVGDRAGLQLFERLDGICQFEVTMDNVPREYEWQPGACAYIESGQWEVEGQ